MYGPLTGIDGCPFQLEVPEEGLTAPALTSGQQLAGPPVAGRVQNKQQILE